MAQWMLKADITPKNATKDDIKIVLQEEVEEHKAAGWKPISEGLANVITNRGAAPKQPE